MFTIKMVVVHDVDEELAASRVGLVWNICHAIVPLVFALCPVNSSCMDGIDGLRFQFLWDLLLES